MKERFLLLLLVALVVPWGFAPAQKRTPAYDRAYQLLESGKAAEALVVIDAALERDASNPGLYNLRGLAAGELGRDQQAEASFRKVIELAPRAAMGYNNLAAFFSARGRQAEAAELFGRALEREPQNLVARAGLGITLAALQRYAQAAPHLERARRLEPRDFQIGYEYAHALRELKRPLEAEKALAAVAPPPEPALAAKYFSLSAVVAEDRGKRKRAVELYARAYELAPESFDVYVALVRAALASGVNAGPSASRKTSATSEGPGARPKTAAGTSSESPQVLPARSSSPGPSASSALSSLPAPPAHRSAEEDFTLGLLFASRGAYAQAVPFFEATLRREPASYAAAYNLALAYKGAGKVEAAIPLVQQELEKKPTAELNNLLASLDEAAGRYLEAVRYYQKAVELEPNSEPYYFDLGTEYLAHFTFGPALEVFGAGTRKFPLASRQHVGLGFAHYARREYPEAAEAFLSALEIDPSSPSAFAAWNSLPAFLAPAEWEKGLPRLSRLAELHPQNAEALYCYGVSLFRQELALGKGAHFDQAQSLLERALRLKPSLAEAHLELGNLYAARNENQKAVEQFLGVIRLDPNSEMAHYRLGQVYRDLNRLERAERELARYSELTRRRREEMARSRSAIKQFILAQSGPSGAPTTDPDKAPR